MFTSLTRRALISMVTAATIVGGAGAAIAQDKIKLMCQCEPDMPFVYADICLIERVMDNLIENAFTFSKSGDSVIVTAKQIDSKIKIEVTDSGCGIDPKDVPKIFDQFYQAQNKHRKGSHAGLGLSIVKRILELHGEQIDVSSELNKGTRFCFSIGVFNSHT